MTIPDHVIEEAAKEIWAILGMDLEADIDRLFSDLTKAQQTPYLTAASFALAHALAALWQPIESAPRDGTHILIKSVHSEAPIVEAWWLPEEQLWTDGVATCTEDEVAMWAPLQQPPEAT